MSSSARWISRNRKQGNGSSRASAPTTSPGGANFAPASGYNPASGSFHTIDATSASPTKNQVIPNGRFGIIEDTDDNSGAHVEYDSVSNAESLSAESAEENAEKPAQQAPPPQPRPEPIPGADTDDKREKMRLKNERKHQRQKEKRAHELDERCSGYLMSRKLEVLSEQLVAMGFSREQATMALIVNEGKVEKSVGWLFEAGEEDRERYYARGGPGGSGSLKIDVSAELARIADVAAKFNATKQEVQRAVVSCEGNVERAEEVIRAQKEEPRVPTPEENSDREETKAEAVRSSPVAVQGRSNARGSSVDVGSKNVQVLRRKQPSIKPEWSTQQQQQQQQVPAAPVEKRWPDGGGPRLAGPSQSVQPLRVSPRPTKVEPQYVPIANELKNLQFGSRKGPVVVQRPPQPVTSGPSRGPYLNPIEPPKPPGVIQRPSAPAKSVAPSKVGSTKPMHEQRSYQSQPKISSGPMGSQGVAPVHVSSSCVVDLGGTTLPLGSGSSVGGLNISGIRGPSYGSSSPSLYQNDWRAGISKNFNYSDVDWSCGPLTPSPTGGLWTMAPQEQSPRTYELFGNGGGLVGSYSVAPVVGNNGHEGFGWFDELQDGGGLAGLGFGSDGAFLDGGGSAGSYSSGVLQGGGGAVGFGPIGAPKGGIGDGGAVGLGPIGAPKGSNGGGAVGFGPIGGPSKGSNGGGGAVGFGPIGASKGSNGGGLGPIGPSRGGNGGGAAGFGPIGGPSKGSNGGGGGGAGLGPVGALTGGTGAAGSGPVGAAGSSDDGSFREWTSPFEERDIFGITRQFVFSPPR